MKQSFISKGLQKHTLSSLFHDLGVEIHDPLGNPITNVTASSKEVGPGSLFFARKGKTFDGNAYIPEAIAKGAVAILTDRYIPSTEGVAHILHPHPETVIGIVADRLYDHPSRKLFLVGITGTNGKTTTAYMVRSLLQTLRGSCGLIGTIETIIGEKRFASQRTTPDVTTNHRLLAEMVKKGGKVAVMEVSSHALDQKRVAEIDFDIGVYTNLSSEHLDYHHTMDAYAEAKRQLFLSLQGEGKRAVVNGEDPWCETIISGCQVPILTYGLYRPCDLEAKEISCEAEGSRFFLCYKGERVPTFLPLPGEFNVYNALAAAGVLLEQGYSLEKIAFHLQSLPPVPGRMERVAHRYGFHIFIDYAHTPDALENVLSALKKIPHRRILTVFGCGGDRDRKKRPRMAEIGETYSDDCIVTNDNPRSEDPEKIAQEIFSGFQNPQRHHKQLDRREAIRYALDRAKEGDILLVAGKGHEQGQIFGEETLPFTDREMIEELLQERP